MKMGNVLALPFGSDDVYNLDTVEGGKEAVEMAVNSHDKLVETLSELLNDYDVANSLTPYDFKRYSDILKGLEDE